LSIVRYYRKYKTRYFGNWICFLPQMMGGRHLLSCVPEKELTSITRQFIIFFVDWYIDEKTETSKLTSVSENWRLPDCNDCTKWPEFLTKTSFFPAIGLSILQRKPARE
jgi:hypothetical protein